MDTSVAQHRWQVLALALIEALGLTVLGAGSALAQSGGDRRARAAMGIQLSPEQLEATRSMMAGCMGR